MGHHIDDLQIAGINRYLEGTAWKAKRSRSSANEVIVGRGDGTVTGAITIKLADNPSTGRPTWYIGVFFTTSAVELSSSPEVVENPSMSSAVYWRDMLVGVFTATEQLSQ